MINETVTMRFNIAQRSKSEKCGQIYSYIFLFSGIEVYEYKDNSDTIQPY
jgi:hypothetical protein